MSEEALEPCALCGCEEPRARPTWFGLMYAVSCIGCGSRIERDTETEAVENWNCLHGPTHTAELTRKLAVTVLDDRTRRLVIAARVVAYTDAPDLEALDELDKAAEAFAAEVPWDDEPDAALSDLRGEAVS